MVLALAGLASVYTRPVAAQQTGGLPELARTVAAMQLRVDSLAQINSEQAAMISALTNRLNQVDATLAAHGSRIVAVETKTAPIQVSGRNFVITGKNVFIQDGSGNTASSTGLGNLTIGYNALRGFGFVDNRTGTHNLVLGDLNNYSSFGGAVFGYFNTISNEFASVTGGFNSTASGRNSSVSGGSYNSAINTGASVSGGSGSAAEGISASVSGGFLNRAIGDSSSVSGGQQRHAPLKHNWVAGTLLEVQ